MLFNNKKEWTTDIYRLLWWLSGKQSAYQCRRHGFLILGSGRAPEEGNGNPLHYSCPENPSGRGVWLATIHGVKKELDTV